MDFAFPSSQMYLALVDETIWTFIYLLVPDFDYSQSQVSEDEFGVRSING